MTSAGRCTRSRIGGGAHFKGAHATAARDAVKKEALRRAGIGYVEVVTGDTPAELGAWWSGW